MRTADTGGLPEACNFIKKEILTLRNFHEHLLLQNTSNDYFFTGELRYRISSNKRHTNNRRTFEYPHWNNRLPLISVAPLNVSLIRIVTIFA